MSVSLKNPSYKENKVDLSKPTMPGKLPECTPVHLLDEEETIQSCISQPKRIDSLPVEQIRLCRSEEEDREIWYLYDKFMRHEHLNRILFVVAITCSVIVLAVLSVIIVLNISSSDILSKSFSEFLSIMSEVLDYLGNNSLYMLLMVLSLIGFGIKIMRCLINVTRK